MSNIIHEIQLFYAQNEDKDFFDEILLVGFGHMPREHVADIRVFELPAGFDVREYRRNDCIKHGRFVTLREAVTFAERRADEITDNCLEYNRTYGKDKHGIRDARGAAGVK